MTVQEIEKLIETEYATFQQSIFIGTLPKDLITIFKRAILEVAPNKHQLHTKTLNAIISKKEGTLSFVEVGMVINVILGSPLKILSDNLDAALLKLKKIEEVRNDYNVSVQRKESELVQKKRSLMELAGASNGQMRRIVN